MLTPPRGLPSTSLPSASLRAGWPGKTPGATAEADSEFDLCLKRRGEATAAFLDDVPTYRMAAALSDYQGRVHEALGSPDARGFYEAFLRIKQPGDELGLVADARKRLAALK